MFVQHISTKEKKKVRNVGYFFILKKYFKLVAANFLHGKE